MDERETRILTLVLACFSLTSISFFVLVYAPAALSAAPGASFRPMTVVPLLAAVLAMGGWVPVVVMGICQLFAKPRIYGLLSIGIGMAHLVSFRIAQWLLMDLRGIRWGT